MIDNARCYIGNVSFRIDRETLREAFSAYGRVTNVHLPIDYETKRNKGYAFIQYATPEEAQLAVARADGGELDGRTLRVQIATPRPLLPT